MQLINTRTQGVVASDVEVADTRRARRRGLLGRTGLAPGAALVLSPCNAVHTFGMQFAIDVVFVDRHYRVRKIVRDLPPWRMAAALWASMTIEMPAGVLGADLVRVNDRLSLESVIPA